MKMIVYYEMVPREYVGDFPSVTIRYRPQDKDAAEALGLSLGGKRIGFVPIDERWKEV